MIIDTHLGRSGAAARRIDLLGMVPLQSISFPGDAAPLDGSARSEATLFATRLTMLRSQAAQRPRAGARSRIAVRPRAVLRARALPRPRIAARLRGQMLQRAQR